jgi:hypothetical protein
VVAPADQFGRDAETAWVVTSVGVHWVKTHLLESPTITRTWKHQDIALTGRDSADREIKVEPREYPIPSGPQPAPPKKVHPSAFGQRAINADRSCRT